MELEKVCQALRKNRYEARVFSTKEEARDWLAGQFSGQIIGFRDSLTMVQMGLYEALSAKNRVIDPVHPDKNWDFLQTVRHAMLTDYFFTSVNGMTEDGVLVNMDGTGNRVAGSLFGHKKVFFIVGRNKIAPTLEEAVWRVRNIAAPKNAQRLGKNTPCALKGDRCYDCQSPERICNGLLIEYKKMSNMEMEVILIDEDLGF